MSIELNPPDLDLGEPWYEQRRSNHGELTLFEAGQRVGGEHHTERSEPLAECQFPVPSAPSPRSPDPEEDCGRVAVAKIVSRNSEWPVCEKHHEKVRKQHKARARD